MFVVIHDLALLLNWRPVTFRHTHRLSMSLAKKRQQNVMENDIPSLTELWANGHNKAS
jgi:hypothetical protein